VSEDLLDSIRSLRPHAAHTPFEVKRRLIILLLILQHVNNSNIVFTGADGAGAVSQRRLGVAFKACLRYILMRRRLDHVSLLESTVTGTLLVDNFQFLSFLYKMFVILFICFP
jgi:hypothetical protein